MLRNQTGSTLVAVMIIAVVMLITTLAVVQLAGHDATLAMRDVRASQAFYTAEAGAERGAAWLLCQSTYPTDTVTPFGEGPDTFGDGLFLTSVTPDFSGSRTIYTITSYATLGDDSRAVEIDIVPQSFTDYLYFVNKDVGPGSPGYFRTGDTVDGPIHINDEIAIWGDPVFESYVESSAATVMYYNDGSPLHTADLENAPNDVPDFQEGCLLGAEEFGWISQSDLNTLKNMADITANSSEIVFGRDDGSGPMLGWVSYRKIGKTKWTDVELSTINGIIYINGNCEVSGIVDGQVTVCTNGIMDIVDDILYADSDADGPCEGCDDVLGLVSGSKVRVADNGPNGSDCVIHAHIAAINNQGCLVEHHGQGSPRGTLTLHGGIAQDKWGPVGTGYYDIDGVFHVLTGYERDFHYDWRLQQMMPPGYSVFATGIGLRRLAWREIEPVRLVEGD